MLHAECKPRYLESQDASVTEPCSKRMKSTEEPYGKSYDGLQRLHEEIHIKKTHSGFIPLSLPDDHEVQQEKEPAEVVDQFNKAFPGKKIVSSEPSNSVNKSEGETELYSTSKAFIGPLYKNETSTLHDQKKFDSSSPKRSNTTLGRSNKKIVAPKQALPCDVPKLEDELSQFYSEISQLESNENCLDSALQGTETNSHKQPVEHNKWNQKVCESSQEWPCKTFLKNGDGYSFYNESNNHRTGREQYHSGNSGHRSGFQRCCDHERNVREAEQLCNRHEGSRFYNSSLAQLRPSWQHTHPFIVPYSPIPPQFPAHFSFQEPNSSLLHSDIFQHSNVGPFKNSHINMSSSISDQNSEYANHFGTHTAQTTRSGYNVPDEHVVNGFCETRPCWEDIRSYQTEGSNIVSQQFPEDKLCESQKLLLILRGLPGSGKTTLSHILLGQSRDGIVFSTDDYFRQNNGCWSYNVCQLGAAHDWNQKRAKQAMDQGRSPIIIDNTNTQAWEMKPYVEAALEKGYRVEFREPDTWWKFNPEELEKRNQHGVIREKIVQMLERYEYQISIPIVMNSVLPLHKISQTPPPQRRQRESVVKKKHRLHKMKQKRKRKRNRKMKGATIKAMEKKSNGQLTPSDEDTSQSEQDESEDSEKSVVTGHLNVPKDVGEDGSAIDNDLKPPELQKGFLDSSMVDPITLGNSVKTDALVRINSQPLISLPSVPNENIHEQKYNDHLPDIFVESKSNILDCNSETSLKMDHSGKENGACLSNMENKDTSPNVMPELGLERKLLSHEEATIPHQHETSKNEKNTWAFFSFDSTDNQPPADSAKSESYLMWQEDTFNIIYEQRPKKIRRPKQVISGKTAELTDDKSNKEFRRGDAEMLCEKDGLTDCALPSPLTESIYNVPCIETNELPPESETKVSIPNEARSLSSARKQRRCKRIFKLAPNFDIPRQIPARKDEAVLKYVHVLTEQEDISNEETGKENKQSLGCFECPSLSSHDVVVTSSHLDVELLCYNCSNQPTEQCQLMDFSAEAATVPIQICTSASCKASIPTEEQIVAFDQTLLVNTEKERMKIPPDASTTQPDILCSVKTITEYLTDPAAENLENIQQVNETENTKYSQIKEDKAHLNTKPNFLGLPLSQGFAVQLVELFGSPGIPLDALLPDDYVVPLDWATSKEIYLQWKTSVEKKQKNNVLKENSSLPEFIQFCLCCGWTSVNSQLE
ncbi:uncharacterized protein LOC123029082 isoform X2 [Varanus komodoensis]|uniref:uncharacterized protein LOC123029082 isoform X2 n=1 Tax=Varanus komodoensis TaxID=61221 RepID=UPI001CF7A22B|nr:uncharacterized protein LOC123029082 isoform X2 [Varanus komodoensis]